MPSSAATFVEDDAVVVADVDVDAHVGPAVVGGTGGGLEGGGGGGPLGESGPAEGPELR